MNAKSLRVMVFAGFASASGLVMAQAATPVGEPGGLLGPEQSLEIDANGVAEALNISPVEAKRRLLVQERAGEISARIRTQYAKRLAGIYIEHEPRSRLVVRLTGTQAIRPEFVTVGNDTLEVDYRVGAQHTLSDLQTRFDAVFARLARSMPELQGGFVDEKTGDYVVEALRSKAGQRLALLKSTVIAELGGPTRVVMRDTPTRRQAVFGSGELDYLVSGLWYECTGAFVVEQPATGRYGSLTAGHCSPTTTYSYLGQDGATHTLTHVFRKYDSAADIGWATIGTSLSSVGPWFYANAWRQLTGRRTRTSTNVGDSICKFGRNGGYGCATVTSTGYNPGAICGPSGSNSCLPNYVALNSPSGLCQGGDSGGPWFISTVAAGVHTAGNGASLCVYTSTDYAYSHLNVQLLY